MQASHGAKPLCPMLHGAGGTGGRLVQDHTTADCPKEAALAGSSKPTPKGGGGTEE